MRELFTAVSPEDLRALQLGLLDAFDQHCREADLRYYIWAGTLLGARRHGGYIPWDDDIDVTTTKNCGGIFRSLRSPGASRFTTSRAIAPTANRS